MKIGIVGLGTIGSGVVSLLEKNKKIIQEKTGINIEIDIICDIDKDIRRPFDIKNYNFTTDANEVINSDIDVFIELVGGTTIAYDFIEKALKNKKNVITANKALLAERGEPLYRIARENNVCLRFEASSGGGIPIVEALIQGLASNKINKILGILNGTSNYVLSQMKENKMDFKQALSLAQDKGYAEADPTLDIDGTDAAHKLAIIGSLAFNKYIDYNNIYKSGIEYITLDDMILAEEMGYGVKLLAIAKQNEENVEAMVYLSMIPKNHILNFVRNEYNAVYVEGNMTGPMLFYGKGAGDYPTASAVVSDIIWIARQKKPLSFPREKTSIKPFHSIEKEYYMRFMTVDKPGVLARISNVLGKYNISIAQMVQRANDKSIVPVVLITHKALENNIQQAISEIESMTDIIKDKVMIMRIEK